MFDKFPLLRHEFEAGVGWINRRVAYSRELVRHFEMEFERGEPAHSTEVRLREMKHWKYVASMQLVIVFVLRHHSSLSTQELGFASAACTNLL